ncbi:MAG: aldehyde dehydrogenase [Oscillospiraceae bacterium]|nr:aldehyde dehydrogenase [Oscillospiraceae bacterium]
MPDVREIVAKQREYFFSGATRPTAFRAAALKKLREAVKRHEEDILTALKQDLNKPPFEAYVMEVSTTLDEISYALKHLKQWVADKPVPTPMLHFPARSFRHPEPYGCVLIMSPWNYPVLLTLAPLVGAIAAGNCAVVKPSAYSPATSSVIAAIAREIFPEEYVAVVEGGRKENETLLSNKFDSILFTGSVAVGKIVMEAASKHLTPVTLELGGKNPCIVDGTLDMDLTARRIAWGKCANAGQICLAPDCLFIRRGYKQAFVEAFAKAVKASYGENPAENDELCRVINRKHFDRLLGLMEDARVLSGGRSDPETLKIEPTLLDNVTWDSKVMGEEVFGPLLPILEYDGLDEVIRELHAHPKPLALYVFTKDAKTADHVVNSTSSGGCCVNDVIIHTATSYMPFGGVGDSGMGGYHGKDSFDTFTHYKSTMSKSKRIDIPLRYPPYGDKLKLVKKILK